ncbi:hypothetical protein AMTRI_Chr04g246360 [Amborella trichopoda]
MYTSLSVAATAAHPFLSVYMQPLKPLSLGISLLLVTIAALLAYTEIEALSSLTISNY